MSGTQTKKGKRPPAARASPRGRSSKARAQGATLVRLDTLKPWDRNYNRGDVGAIAKSIEAFGFNGTLRVWRDGIVIAGNHALKALQQMRTQGALPPEHVTVAKDGEWLIPTTSVGHLDREQAQAFAIADNRTRDLASTDDALLGEILQELAAQDHALLEATGFDDDDVRELLASLEDSRVEDDEEEAEPAGTHYLVVVTCTGEDHQREVYDQLVGEGLTCKAVSE